jgi:hypothetical protein
MSITLSVNGYVRSSIAREGLRLTNRMAGWKTLNPGLIAHGNAVHAGKFSTEILRARELNREAND